MPTKPNTPTKQDKLVPNPDYVHASREIEPWDYSDLGPKPTKPEPEPTYVTDFGDCPLLILGLTAQIADAIGKLPKGCAIALEMTPDGPELIVGTKKRHYAVIRRKGFIR